MIDTNFKEHKCDYCEDGPCYQTVEEVVPSWDNNFKKFEVLTTWKCSYP